MGSHVNRQKITSFQESIDPTPSIEKFNHKNHHEDTPAFRQRFVGDMKSLLENFVVNAIDPDDFITVNNSTIDFDKDQKSIKNSSDFSNNQLKDVQNKHLVKAEKPITETISKNNLQLSKHMIDG